MIKPQTFMNLSGQSIGEALRFYRLPPSALTVFYDELDLVAGKVRAKIAGGTGGHNGIKSIDSHIGKDYRRVRIGIGHPGVKELVHGHVLGDFAKADAGWLDPLLESIADSVGYLVKNDDNGFMNRVTLAVKAIGETKEDSRPAPKPQSHIREARLQKPSIALPETGPMAAMLKKLFGKA